MQKILTDGLLKKIENNDVLYGDNKEEYKTIYSESKILKYVFEDGKEYPYYKGYIIRKDGNLVYGRYEAINEEKSRLNHELIYDFNETFFDDKGTLTIESKSKDKFLFKFHEGDYYCNENSVRTTLDRKSHTTYVCNEENKFVSRGFVEPSIWDYTVTYFKDLSLAQVVYYGKTYFIRDLYKYDLISEEDLKNMMDIPDYERKFLRIYRMISTLESIVPCSDKYTEFQNYLPTLKEEIYNLNSLSTLEELKGQTLNRRKNN